VKHLTAARSELLSPADLARQFGVPKPRIYELARRGGLEPIRIGRLIRFRSDDVEAFVSNGGERIVAGVDGR
jgi:excisionase family DNA binding protein